MYGGTAPTFRTWDFNGEPFQEGKNWYILAINPNTKRERKVRWYTDASSHNAMPANQAQLTHIQVPFYSIFGFENEEDCIVAIKEKDLSETEITKFFSGKWRYADILSGLWYAPKETPLPKVKRESYFKIAWRPFQEECLARAVKLGYDGSRWTQ